MIQIAFVVHGMQTGGIERSVTRIIKGLDRQLFSPLVICLDRTGPAAAWLADDVPVIEIKKRSGNDFLAILRLRSVLCRHKIDLVQSHNWGTLIETIIARKMAGVRAHVHAERGTVLGSLSGKGWRQACRAWAMKVALKFVDRVMSNSHAVARRVQDRSSYPADRITVVPNGVRGYSTEGRTQARQQVGRELGIAESELIVGTVGRLHEVKGFDILIQAAAILCSTFKSLHILIVGEGEQREMLERLIDENQLKGRIHLVGHQDQVISWLLAIDIYVNSSRSEGMSQSIVEAMSVGLPIVATDVGDAQRMLCHGGSSCGVTCKPNDIQALADSILMLANDGALRSKYGHTSQIRHRERYDEEVFSNSMRTFYLETLNLNQQSSSELTLGAAK